MKNQVNKKNILIQIIIASLILIFCFNNKIKATNNSPITNHDSNQDNYNQEEDEEEEEEEEDDQQPLFNGNKVNYYLNKTPLINRLPYLQEFSYYANKIPGVDSMLPDVDTRQGLTFKKRNKNRNFIEKDIPHKQIQYIITNTRIILVLLFIAVIIMISTSNKMAKTKRDMDKQKNKFIQYENKAIEFKNKSEEKIKTFYMLLLAILVLIFMVFIILISRKKR